MAGTAARNRSFVMVVLDGILAMLLYLCLVVPLRVFAGRSQQLLRAPCAGAARLFAPLSASRVAFLICCLCLICAVHPVSAPPPLVAANANGGFYALGHDTLTATRLQVVACFMLGFANYEAIARFCGNISARTVRRIIGLWIQTGSVGPGKRGRRRDDEGMNVKLGRGEKQFLRGLLRNFPNLQLAEIQERLYRDLGVYAATSTISATLKRTSWYRKKIQSVAIEKFSLANVIRTLRFLIFRHVIDVEDCVWLDEIGVQDVQVKRLYGRAPGAKRARVMEQYVPQASRVNIVGAMTVHEVLPCSLAFRGSMKGWLFEWWVLHMLLPCLRPGQTVIVDNAPFHRKNVLQVLFALAGVNLLFLPAYSPEYNPIECVW
jgi:transposase